MGFCKAKAKFQLPEDSCNSLKIFCQGTGSGDCSDNVPKHVNSPRSYGKPSLLTSDEVREEYRDCYIYSGYRPMGLSPYQCVLSLFQWHNETLNFWTHWFTLLFYIWFFYSQQFNLVFDSRYWPLLSVAIGACAFPFFSCVAHTFGCMTVPVRHFCFFCDYAGISIYSIGSSVAFYSYSISRDLQGTLVERLYIPLNVILAVLSCALCCIARDNKWAAVRCVLCSLAFSAPYIFYGSVLVHRLATTEFSPSFWFHYWQFFWTLAFAITKSAKIPERLKPQAFDIIGHSHQWFHVLVFIATYHQINAVILDLQELKATQTLSECSFFSTIGVVLLVIVMDALVVAYFSYRVLEKYRGKKD